MNCRNYIRLLLFFTILLLQSTALCLGGETSIFSPGIGHDSSGVEPFIVGPTQRTVRYQQVYGASDFNAIASGGWINGFEIDLVGGGLCCDFILPNTEIRLSVTQKQPDGLSPVFLENVGANESVVFGAGPLRIAAMTGTGFDILIPFSTPYYYDPTMGNLLLEVRNYVGPNYPVSPNLAGLLAFADTLGDSVSRVYIRDVNATSGELSTAGLVTLFRVTPVPELSISLQSSNLLFRWVNQGNTFRLQQSGTVGPGATWQPTGGTISTNGTYVEARVPLVQQTTARFFRLVLQPSSPSAAGSELNNGLSALSNQKP